MNPLFNLNLLSTSSPGVKLMAKFGVLRLNESADLNNRLLLDLRVRMSEVLFCKEMCR